MKGRQLLDGVALVQELIQSLNKHNCQGILLNLDMTKAFDKVNWSFLKNILNHFGFVEDWIQWILSLFNTPFSILVNGSSTGFFKNTRDLKQGGPLSPYLFILLVEALGCNLTLLQLKDHILGLQICSNFSPSHIRNLLTTHCLQLLPQYHNSWESEASCRHMS